MIRRAIHILTVMALWGCSPVQDVGSRQAPAPAPAPVVFATADPKNAPAEGGIGGTGIDVAGGEGGIGGTGAPRLAGTLGTVTGFGSIHINGLRIVFPPSGEIIAPSGFVAERDIDLGETLEVLGVLQTDGTIRPTQAMFRFPLVGRIDSVDPTGATLSIMGARVILEPDALLVDQTNTTAQIFAGDIVQVSGLTRGGDVIASRVEKTLAPVRTSVMGRVESGPRPGTVRINGVTVDYGSGVPPQIGWSVRVSGAYEDGRLVPYETVRSLMETVTDPIPDLSIEGYLEPRNAPVGLGIGGFGREFDAGSKVTGLAGDRALFIGALDAGTFKARHGLRLPTQGTTRRALLEAVENGYAPAGAVETR